VVFGLVGLGVVMSFSASLYTALIRQHNIHFFLKREVLQVLIAFIPFAIGITVPYHRIRKLAYIIFIASLVSLALLFVCGETRNKSTRWFNILGFSLQPGEFAKLAFVIYLAESLTRKVVRGTVRTFTIGVLPHLFGWGLMFLLFFKQPDLGTGIVLACLLFSMSFVAGAPVGYLATPLVVLAPLLIVYVQRNRMRAGRWTAFLNPEENRLGAAFQTFNAQLAISRGGLTGSGLGNALLKLGFVPEAHTDFVLAVIAEEIGLGGILLVVFAFGVIMHRGYRIAMAARDEFGRMLAVGITLLLGIQASINVGVVVGALPAKGLTLPFVSFGGSSLMACMLAVGILLNIGLAPVEPVDNEEPRHARRRLFGLLPAPRRATRGAP
jgi:cell division protein FtsW